MKNDAYWAKRMKIIEESLLDTGYEYVQNLEKQYERAIREIEVQISDWYRRFAGNNNITLTEARHLLAADELEEFHWTVREYIEHGQENALSQTWIKQLENASARIHISRLDSLKIRLQQQAEALHGEQAAAADSLFGEIYKSGYYRTAFEVQKGVGFGWPLQNIADAGIKRVLSRPWTPDGQTFSDRIWANKQSLVNTVNTQLTQMIMRGQAPDKAIKAVSDRFKVSKRQAGRLVMTESAAFSSMAQRDCFKELDVEQYQIIAALDKMTCSLCGELDNKVYKMSEYAVGSTAPPFHPWCRCCTAPYFADMAGVSERFARDVKTGKAYDVPNNMTYNDWKKQQDAMHGAGTVDTERKMAYNASDDRRQWSEYKELLGNDAPGSFSDFQELKYRDADGWAYTKQLVKYLKKYPGSDKRYFDIRQTLKAQGIDRGVALPPVQKNAYILPNGKRDPYHLMHRMIERCITDDEVRSYMKDAKIMFVQWGGDRQVFVSENGTSVITMENDQWIYKTAWKAADNDEIFDRILEVMRNAGL